MRWSRKAKTLSGWVTFASAPNPWRKRASAMGVTYSCEKRTSHRAKKASPGLTAGTPSFPDFASALGKALHKPSWLPVPAFALRLAVGEFAETILHGRRVVPQKLEAIGFTWKYRELGAALAAALTA